MNASHGAAVWLFGSGEAAWKASQALPAADAD